MSKGPIEKLERRDFLYLIKLLDIEINYET